MPRPIATEDLAAAIAIQDQQRRLGVRVASIDELLGLATPKHRTKLAPNTHHVSTGPLRQSLPSRATVSYTSTIIPYGVGTLGGEMESNATVSHNLIDLLRVELRAIDCTPAQVGFATMVMLEIIEALPVEKPVANTTASEIAARLGTTGSAVSRALTHLETAGAIVRGKARPARPIYVSPRLVYRGRSARFSEALAEFERLVSPNTATTI